MCVCASLLLARRSSPADEVLYCPITRCWLCATDVIFMVMGLISFKVRGVVCGCVCVCVCVDDFHGDGFDLFKVRGMV